ncbi:MAG: acyltransferase family protein [Odoribacter sp.]|nr:acyltransferase family protein [Odoribacter sp.]
MKNERGKIMAIYNNKNRIEYIDLARGVGIFLMIACHIGVPVTIQKIVYGFHMPLFFFISGLFFKPGRYKSISELLQKLSKQFVLPYVFFCVIQWIVWLFTESNGSFSIIPLLQCFWVNMSSSLAFSRALWFLTAMFWVHLIYYLLSSYIKNSHIRSVSVALIGAGGIS